jgi:hypothetical protein
MFHFSSSNLLRDVRKKAKRTAVLSEVRMFRRNKNMTFPFRIIRETEKESEFFTNHCETKSKQNFVPTERKTRDLNYVAKQKRNRNERNSVSTKQNTGANSFWIISRNKKESQFWICDQKAMNSSFLKKVFLRNFVLEFVCKNYNFAKKPSFANEAVYFAK